MFCPSCHTKLVVKKEDNKTIVTCPKCGFSAETRETNMVVK